jgi:cysteine desulfurase/selenocysteine lyase
MDNVRAHERAITEYAIDGLLQVPGVSIQGPLDASKRGGAVSFTVEGVHPHDVSTIVDSFGIAIRAGHHCAQLLMRKLELPATNRASFYIYNTRAEVDALVAAIKEAQKVFDRAGTRTAV